MKEVKKEVGSAASITKYSMMVNFSDGRYYSSKSLFTCVDQKPKHKISYIFWWGGGVVVSLNIS
jgi:hypothetical protein